MGWHINLVKNDVEITEAIAEELFKVMEREGYEFINQFYGDGKLRFDPDMQEHMDYLWMGDVQDVLKKHKVKGDICFASEAGDNAGQAWGYRFDGKGGMVPLTGKRFFVETPPQSTIKLKPGKGESTKKSRRSSSRARGGTRSRSRVVLKDGKTLGRLERRCTQCSDIHGKTVFVSGRDRNGRTYACAECGETAHIKKIRV